MITVIPAHAGIQTPGCLYKEQLMRSLQATERKTPCVHIMASESHGDLYRGVWIPASAGMTGGARE